MLFFSQKTRLEELLSRLFDLASQNRVLFKLCDNFSPFFWSSNCAAYFSADFLESLMSEFNLINLPVIMLRKQNILPLAVVNRSIQH